MMPTMGGGGVGWGVKIFSPSQGGLECIWSHRRPPCVSPTRHCYSLLAVTKSAVHSWCPGAGVGIAEIIWGNGIFPKELDLFIIFIYLCEWGQWFFCAPCVCRWPRRPEAWGPLQLELQAVMLAPWWCYEWAETKPRSSVRAESTLHLSVISPTHRKILFEEEKKTSAIQWDVKNINLSKSIFDKKKNKTTLLGHLQSITVIYKMLKKHSVF